MYAARHAVRGHSGKAADTAAFGKSHEDRFGLIFTLVCEKEMPNAVTVTSLGHQAITRLAGRVMQVRNNRSMFPPQYFRCDTEFQKMFLRLPGFHRCFGS